MKSKNARKNDHENEGMYRLRLYVAGTLSISARAIHNLQEMLEKYLKGKYDLQIVDVYQQPKLVEQENIIAVPMLIKEAPIPKRLMIGDMSDIVRLKKGLGLE